MIRRRYIYIASVAALAVAFASAALAGAADRVTYAMSLDQAVTTASAPAKVTGPVTFTVTRSAPNDNDPVVWVAESCQDANGSTTSAVAYPALWGLASSLTATTQPFAVSGVTCTAWATVKPWLLDKHRQVLDGTLTTYAVG